MQGNISRINVDNSSYFSVAEPQGAALLKFEWPLYEGGLLQNKLRLAQSKREEAAAALQERTDQALREVALAYDQRQRRLRARRRHTNRRDVRADGARDGARRGGPSTHAVADQRGGACLRDRRADVKYGFRHRDTAMMLLVRRVARPGPA